MGPCLVSEMADGRIATVCWASPPPQPVWLHRGRFGLPDIVLQGHLMPCPAPCLPPVCHKRIWRRNPSLPSLCFLPSHALSLFSHRLLSMTPMSESQCLTMVTTWDASHQHMQHGIAASLSNPASPMSSFISPPLMQGRQPRHGGYLILLSLHCPITSLIWATFI